MNPLDPLLRAGPERQRQLFQQFTKAAHGSPSDDVIGAAVNLLVNSIRQSQPTAKAAERAYDELSAKVKGMLISEHYTSGGRKKGIFPYHQIIDVPLLPWSLQD